MYPKIKNRFGLLEETGKKHLHGIMEPDDKRYCQPFQRVEQGLGKILRWVYMERCAQIPSNETFNLWFNGHDTITAVFQDLAKKTSVNKTDSFIAFAGGSAGGLGVFINYDYVSSILQSTLIGVPIGGYVPNIEWYTGKDSTVPPVDVRDAAFIHHRKLYNAFLPENCLTNLGDSNGYKCLIPRHSYKYSKRPLFIIESLTDSIVLTGFEGVPRTLYFGQNL